MTSSKDNPSDFYEAGFDKKVEAPRQPSDPEEKKDLDSINSLLESVGIAPINREQTEEKAQKDETGTAKTQAPDDGKTKHFDLKTNGSKPQEKKENDFQLTFDGYEDEVKPKIVSAQAVEKQLKESRQNLIENFRVLSNEDGDKAILEKEPTGKGGSSLADLLEPKKGETLFDAVERAGKRKKAKGLPERAAQQKTRLEKLKEELK